MRQGEWVSGVPASEEFRAKYPVVVGPYVPLGFSLLGTEISVDGIEVVDADGVASVVDVEAASPAHTRRPQTVVNHNG